MGSIAFAFPIARGQAEHLFDHLEHVTGAGQEDHHEHNRGRGLTGIRLYHQTEPQEMLIAMMEGPDVEKAFEGMMASPSGTEQRALQMLRNLGGHNAAHLSPAHSTLVMDWHHQEGHRQKPVRPKKG
jgi:hypothetical protein